jgi:hypothetical protein
MVFEVLHRFVDTFVYSFFVTTVCSVATVPQKLMVSLFKLKFLWNIGKASLHNAQSLSPVNENTSLSFKNIEIVML